MFITADNPRRDLLQCLPSIEETLAEVGILELDHSAHAAGAACIRCATDPEPGVGAVIGIEAVKAPDVIFGI